MPAGHALLPVIAGSAIVTPQNPQLAAALGVMGVRMAPKRHLRIRRTERHVQSLLDHDQPGDDRRPLPARWRMNRYDALKIVMRGEDKEDKWRREAPECLWNAREKGRVWVSPASELIAVPKGIIERGIEQGDDSCLRRRPHPILRRSIRSSVGLSSMGSLPIAMSELLCWSSPALDPVKRIPSPTGSPT